MERFHSIEKITLLIFVLFMAGIYGLKKTERSFSVSVDRYNNGFEYTMAAPENNHRFNQISAQLEKGKQWVSKISEQVQNLMGSKKTEVTDVKKEPAGDKTKELAKTLPAPGKVRGEAAKANPEVQQTDKNTLFKTTETYKSSQFASRSQEVSFDDPAVENYDPNNYWYGSGAKASKNPSEMNGENAEGSDKPLFASEQWKQIILDNPTRENMTDFINAYNSGTVETETFFLVVETLLEDARPEAKARGLQALNAVEAYEAFVIAVNFESQLDGNNKVMVTNIINSYSETRKLATLRKVFAKSHQSNILKRANSVLLKSVQGVANTGYRDVMIDNSSDSRFSYNTNGSRDFSSRNPSGRGSEAGLNPQHHKLLMGIKGTAETRLHQDNSEFAPIFTETLSILKSVL